MIKRFPILIYLLVSTASWWTISSCSVGTEQPTVVGIAHNAGKYSFTEDDLLNEGAEQILALGAESIAIYMGPDYSVRYRGIESQASTLRELAQTSSYRRFFEKPFKVIAINCYSFSAGMDPRLNRSLSDCEPHNAFNEILELAEYLYSEYQDNEKTIILKNLDGDSQFGHLFDGHPSSHKSDLRTAIDWFKARSDAVAKARRSAPEDAKINLLSAVEFSKVQGVAEGRKTVLTEIVPQVNADLYSYEAGELADKPQWLYRHIQLISRYVPGASKGTSRIIIGGFRAEINSTNSIRNLDWLIKICSKLKVKYLFATQIYDSTYHGTAYYPSDVNKRKNLKCAGIALVDPLGRKTPARQFLKNRVFQDH